MFLVLKTKDFYRTSNEVLNVVSHLLYRYLHNVLGKNQTVTEQNKGLLVEILRSISEILIWGDQNDSSVFEYVYQLHIFYNTTENRNIFEKGKIGALCIAELFK